MRMEDLMNQQKQRESGKATFIKTSSGNAEYDKWMQVIEDHGGVLSYYKRDPRTGKPTIEDPGSPVAMKILQDELSSMGLL